MTLQGAFMHMVLVMRQLSGLLDELLSEVTRRVRLTPHDALVLAWVVEKPGIGAAMIGALLGRRRQSVQRSLERLEDRLLVERFPSDCRDRASGWGLTDQGRETWNGLVSGWCSQDASLEARGVALRSWVKSLEHLMMDLRGARRRWSEVGLVEPPIDRVPASLDP
jgi:DNA-binding MarR family transcriptional regulator